MKKLLEMVIHEYRYGSKEERSSHVEYMESQGYECTGQVKRSDDDLMKREREYYWFARFQKLM